MKDAEEDNLDFVDVLDEDRKLLKPQKQNNKIEHFNGHFSKNSHSKVIGFKRQF